MPSGRVKIVVRCEDIQQRVFIYRFLCRKGIAGHDIKIVHCPGGDGKQFVLKQYPIEVKALRSGPPASKALVSMIDGDDSTPADRKKQHDEVLAAEGQAVRQSDERIAIVVPKRNIETWIHHLLGESGINEVDEYRKFRGEERRCAPAAEEFARRCPNHLGDDDLPSLKDACLELQRVLD
jgi:hypothetical protein